MLLSLLQTRRDWPGSELAARLGVPGGTVRRDVGQLREVGYRVDALQSMAVPLTGGAPAVQAGTLSAIAAACRGHESLRFGYESGAGTVSERLVEPYRLVASGRRWYLVAFDPGRADWRVFRVDRLRLPRRTGRGSPRACRQTPTWRHTPHPRSPTRRHDRAQRLHNAIQRRTC